MSRAYYWRVIGRWSAPQEVQKLKDGPYLYEGSLPPARLVYRNSLVEGQSPLLLDSAHQESPAYTFSFQPVKGERWLRASAVFYIIEKELATWQMTQFMLTVRRQGQRGQKRDAPAAAVC
jgi:hypothetical protein